MIGYKESHTGTIPEYWDEIPLTKVINKYIDNRGKSVPVADEITKMVLIATNCIKEDNLYPVKEKVRYVLDDIYKNWFRGHPEPGDIIITNKGTPGLVCFVPDNIDFCIAQDMVAIRVNSNLMYNKFLFAFMRSRYFKWQVYALNVGTTIPHLKKTYFNELIIPKPPMPEQILIGDLYFGISKKIDLLSRQNETLEQIAQTLFKRWFLDFEFPDENGRPYKSSGGEMVASELGDIPIGWQVGTFFEFFDLLSGGTPKTSMQEFWNGDIKWISAKDITPNHRRFILNTEKAITENGLNNSATKLLPSYTTIISARGTVGNYCILSEEMCISQSNYGICSKIKDQEFYSYLYVAQLVERLKSKAYGSVFDTITSYTFNDLEIIHPERTISLNFEIFIRPFLQKMLINEREISNLSKIRDSLLPKLMSGRIRVNE
jgi:type I restriction enzyme S subunit